MATKSIFGGIGIINVWGSSLGSKRNLDIGFIMGYRGGFSRKMKKKPEGVGRSPPPSLWELGLRKYIRVRSKLPT